MITDDVINLIDKYLEGSLGKNEVDQFNIRLQTDQPFADLYSFVKDIKIVSKQNRHELLREKIKLILSMEDSIPIEKQPLESMVSLASIETIEIKVFDTDQFYLSMHDLIEEMQIDKDLIEVNDEPVPKSLEKMLIWLGSMESITSAASKKRGDIAILIDKKKYISFQNIFEKIQNLEKTVGNQEIEKEFLIKLIERLEQSKRNWKQGIQDRFFS